MRQLRTRYTSTHAYVNIHVRIYLYNYKYVPNTEKEGEIGIECVCVVRIGVCFSRLAQRGSPSTGHRELTAVP